MVCLAASAEVSPAEKEDTSVTSAVANTLAAIAGRRQPHPHHAFVMPKKLALSKAKAVIRFHTKRQVTLLKKEDTPQQLSGYLGWSKVPAKASFSTAWKNTGEKAAANLYMHDLEEQKATPKKAAPQQALVSSQVVKTAFSKMLEQTLTGDDLPTIEWGSKSKKNSKMALSTSGTKVNKYLDAVGWTAAAVVTAEDNSYMRTLEAAPSKKNFLAAAEVADKVTSGPKTYFDSLMPKYFDVQA